MIIKIQGGLGNQMFQYAYGRKFELAGKKVIFDTSFFNGGRSKVDTARNFKLDKFNIETKAEFSEKRHRFMDLYNGIKRKLGFKQGSFYQSEKYFKNIEEVIRKEFTLKKPVDNKYDNILSQIANTNSISLHIRRGDYVNDKKTKAVHDVCSLDYYSQAVDIIRSSVNNPTFFVFSDDIDWVTENLEINPAWYVSNIKGEDYEELILMSKCKYNIIANSTFSWWGAWLNQNPFKIVIAPKQWFVNKTANELNILPKTWIQI